MYYTGLDGEIYQLGQPIGKGGEGTIYTIQGNNTIVLKEYLPSKRTNAKKLKLEAMLNSRLPQDALNQVTWPIDIVFDQGDFIGYVMPAVIDGQDYNVIHSNKFRFTLEQKLVIAMNLCAAIDAVHSINQICGDLNPKNIQVDVASASIRLIDTDSFHIQDFPNKRIYRCNVGMSEYLAPELQIKARDGLDISPLPTFTVESDLFALAIHIFTILMNGCHPFTCAVIQTNAQESVARPTMVESICQGDFIFYRNNNPNLTTPVYAPKFSWLPNVIQQLFVKAFISGHANPEKRPAAKEWHDWLYKIYSSSPTTSYPQWSNSLSNSSTLKNYTPTTNQNTSTANQTRNSNQSYNNAQKKPSELKIVLAIFAVIFVMVTAFVLYTSDNNSHGVNSTETEENISTTVGEQSSPLVRRVELVGGGYQLQTYNEDGTLISISSHFSDGSIDFSIVYEYDENGNNIYRSFSNSNGVIYLENHYDDDGTHRTATWYTPDGLIDYTVLLEYDESGTVKLQTFSDPFGNIEYVAVPEFDENGKEIRQTFYDLDGNIIEAAIHEYDENGNIVLTTFYDVNGHITGTREH